MSIKLLKYQYNDQYDLSQNMRLRDHGGGGGSSVWIVRGDDRRKMGKVGMEGGGRGGEGWREGEEIRNR